MASEGRNKRKFIVQEAHNVIGARRGIPARDILHGNLSFLDVFSHLILFKKVIYIYHEYIGVCACDYITEPNNL